MVRAKIADERHPLHIVQTRITIAPPMKTSLIFLIATTSALVAAENIIPVAYTKDRYNETFSNSPFALETKVEAPAAPKEDAFKNLELKGLGQADGKDYVIIQKVGESNSMRFWGQEPNGEMSVKEVHWSDRMGETYVIIRKGSEEGKVSFNELALHGGVAQGAPNPAPGRPTHGNFGGNNNAAPGLGNAAQRPPQPSFQPANQPPRPSATPAPNGGFRSSPPGIPSPAAAPNTHGGGRQRIRVINNR